MRKIHFIRSGRKTGIYQILLIILLTFELLVAIISVDGFNPFNVQIYLFRIKSQPIDLCSDSFYF